MISKRSKILKIIFSLSLLSNTFFPNPSNNLYPSQNYINNEDIKLVNNKNNNYENFKDKNTRLSNFYNTFNQYLNPDTGRNSKAVDISRINQMLKISFYYLK